LPDTRPAPHAPEEEQAASQRPETFLAAFGRFALPHLRGRAGRRPRLLVLGLLLLVLLQVALMVRLNVWNADLFDALDRRATADILRQAGIFALLLGGMMLANAAHLQLKRDLQLGWRDWLTARLSASWLSEGRHFALSQMASEHASNPDGRIAEDARIATEHAVDLASTLVHAALLVVAFLAVLWELSGIVHLPLPGSDAGLPVPGHMVALAILYAAGGSAVAFLLGRPLVRVTDERQGREADFRFALSRARESAEPLALARAEPDERARLGALFGQIVAAWEAQTRTLRNLLLFGVGYGQLAPVLPLLVASPRYLAGTLTLGALVQIAQAFQQVVAALSWPVDNAQRLAEWRASAERVIALQRAIATLDEAGRPSLLGAPIRGGLALDRLVVRNPDDSAATRLLTERFAPGEAVRLEGDAHAVSLLCKAIAGQWRWGEGEIHLAEGAMPAICIADPWVPEARLRDILDGAAAPEEGRAEAALSAVGLEELVPRLEETAPWRERLEEGDRQRLMLTQLLLHRPAVIVLEHALRAVPQEDAAELLRLLRIALPESVILFAGALPPGVAGFTRTVQLDRSTREAGRKVHMPRSSGVIGFIQRGFGHRH
jgi:putative ATP-binding cassette transporter